MKNRFINVLLLIAVILALSVNCDDNLKIEENSDEAEV